MNRHSVTAALLVLSASLVACTSTTSDGGGGTDDGGGDVATAPLGDCEPVDLALSPEKITLFTELADEFNASPAAELASGECVVIRPNRKSSGAAATALINGWPDTEGPRPTVWSPAASSWGAIVNERTGSTIAPPSDPFMLTPLVIAMPRPMAEALGWPATPIGFSDIIALAKNPEGWAAFGHPEWGQFKLGKTNPNFSTSGLNFTTAQYYAATGTTSNLSREDLARPEVAEFASNVESAVVHYGDTTLTFLNNLARADQRGASLSYVSAVAVEEKSIIDYNAGNPDGVLDPGEQLREPRVPLVAIYPKEGTLYSDNPYIVLDAEWVTDVQRAGAEAFGEFIQSTENQAKVLEFGFRPGNPAVPVAAPIELANGVDPDQPSTLLEVPQPAVLTQILDLWAEQRKTARVLLVLDVSGSMGDLADPDDPNGPTKLDLAKEAAARSLEQFKDDDEVGLRIFSTDLDADGATFLDLAPIAPIGPVREGLANRIRGLTPTNGTPLYDVTQASYQVMLEGYDATRINAVVLLTDGFNDDGVVSDDETQRQALLTALRSGNEGAASRSVRVFPIAYGADADIATLREVADAAASTVYDAQDATAIDRVFTAVISNF
jgi:Ca-activated chloride channel homolog